MILKYLYEFVLKFEILPSVSETMKFDIHFLN